MHTIDAERQIATDRLQAVAGAPSFSPLAEQASADRCLPSLGLEELALDYYKLLRPLYAPNLRFGSLRRLTLSFLKDGYVASALRG